MGVDHIGKKMSLAEWDRRIRRLAKATLQNSSIGRAGLRIYEGGRLRIEGGGGIDIVGTGYINIDGDITGAGDFQWSGPWKLLGNGTVSGNVAWSGDLNLTGIIRAGNVVINPSAAGGQISFGSNRTIDAGAGFLAIRDGARFMVFNSTGVAINGGSGSPTVTVSVNGVRISGLPKVTKAGIPSGCVYVASDGYLKEG